MIRRTATAMLALVLFSACAKTATTTKPAASTTGATAAPTTTTNPKTRTATASPHATSTVAQPSTAVSISPQHDRAFPHAVVPSARPSTKATSRSVPKTTSAPTARVVVTAAPTSKPTATTTSTPAAVAVVGNIPHGKSLYEQHCANCHGADAQGGMGPSLQNEDSRKNLAQTVAWIKNPALPMPNLYPGTLSDKDVLDIATYVQSLK
ncbi:MAG: cytochrome c [Candidatus Eremiobacteraeota bacterium]|nr:cytochrome c [Candidatus Eremiobacteraeota bacterium]